MMEKIKTMLPGILSFIKSFIVSLIMVLAVLIFVRPSRVIGDSMEPNYHDGQYVMIQVTENVKRNDVAVIWSEELDRYVIKRVVGVAGDIIVVNENGLYRNGQLIYETYVNGQEWAPESQQVALVVGHDQVFAMGDNRIVSIDSRALGLFDKDDIQGRVLFG